MEYKSVQFMTAKEKEGVHRAFERLLKSLVNNGTDEDKAFNSFTNALYEHLHLHCGFIAHYNRMGFYQTYFNGDLEDIKTFLSHFVEDGEAKPYGYTPDYDDINETMANSAAKYYMELMGRFGAETKASAITQAKILIAQNGLSPK
jgi:hypothetical protein